MKLPAASAWMKSPAISTRFAPWRSPMMPNTMRPPRPPVAIGEQPRGERRHGHRRDADAGGDQRDGEAALVRHPGADRSHHRHEKAAGRQADEDAVGEEELRLARGAAREHQAKAE